MNVLLKVCHEKKTQENQIMKIVKRNVIAIIRRVNREVWW